MNKISHDSETAAYGQQVITACAFIHQKVDGVHKVFLPKRASTKKFLPNVHELPGGHIDYGEDIVMGLKREITEEFSMTAEIGDPFFAFTYKNDIKGSHSIEVIYFASFVEDPTNIELNPQDHSEYGWFAEDELANAATEIRPR
jgi:8-oxo-dGTP pyrophosphatase MutT (NUDIX family)